MRSIKRALIALVALAGVALAGCAVDTNESEAAIMFEGRAGQIKVYKGCMKPLERRGGDDGNDQTFLYPAGPRELSFRDGDADRAKIQVVSRDNVTLDLSGSISFALNISCNDNQNDGGALKRFHDAIGVRYNPDPSKRIEDLPAWDQIKVKFIGDPLESAMDSVAKQYDWKQLYQDPAKKQEFLARVAAAMPTNIKAATGSQESFFCSPNFLGAGECGTPIIQVPTVQPPTQVLNAMAQDAANKEINTSTQSEAAARDALVKQLGAQGYLIDKALRIVQECNQRPENRKCQMGPPPIYPQGSTIINTPR